MTNQETAVAVIEQSADSNVVQWQLDAFPIDQFNRLLPTETLMLPTDLLRPVVQVVRLNPDDKAGDVYHSNDMPAGHAAPTKVGLRKLATAAGISIVDERRTDDGTDPDVIEVTCLAEMLLPTGQRIHATGMKRIDLNAQTWASPQQRGKYKSFFLEHVSSRAANRAIRALLSLRGSYPSSVYAKPFAVVSFAPNMNHPEVRARYLDGIAPVAAQLFGGPAAAPKQVGPGAAVVDVPPAPDEDPAPELVEPEWMRAPQVQEQKPAAKAAKPDFLVVMRTYAAEADNGDQLADAEELGKLREVLGPLGGAIVGAGLTAIWDETAVTRPSSGQARAIALVHESLGPEAFAAAWRKVAEQAAVAA